MNLKDKTQRITLRLNEEQFGFVHSTAEVLGVSPSEFLRMAVNTMMTASKKVNDKLEGIGRENDKASIDNQL